MHAKLSGDQGHWHAVTVRGLHSSITVRCGGRERFLGHVHGPLCGLQFGHRGPRGFVRSAHVIRS